MEQVVILPIEGMEHLYDLPLPTEYRELYDLCKEICNTNENIDTSKEYFNNHHGIYIKIVLNTFKKEHRWFNTYIIFLNALIYNRDFIMNFIKNNEIN